MSAKHPILLPAALLGLVTITVAVAQVLEPQPTPLLKKELNQRRSQIQVELDRNHKAVQDLYEILDVTPVSENETRQYLEAQIHQHDSRSNVLFDELDAIDMHEFQQERKIELQKQADQLSAEAKQLRAAGKLSLAFKREEKVTSIRKMLADGTWKMLTEKEWSCDQPEKDLVSAIVLMVEVEKLKAETKSLKNELKELKSILSKLTR